MLKMTSYIDENGITVMDVDISLIEKKVSQIKSLLEEVDVLIGSIKSEIEN